MIPMLLEDAEPVATDADADTGAAVATSAGIRETEAARESVTNEYLERWKLSSCQW